MPTAAAAENLIAQLTPPISFYKLGHELMAAGHAVPLAHKLIARGQRVFMDLKLYDTPRTVARTIKQICAMGAEIITVAPHRQIMTAAVRAAPAPAKIVAVPALTSWAPEDYPPEARQQGQATYMAVQTDRALSCGCAGVITPAPYAASLREQFGPELLLITPGITTGTSLPGQNWTARLAEVLATGVNYAVLGRIITAAPQPALALRAELSAL